MCNGHGWALPEFSQASCMYVTFAKCGQGWALSEFSQESCKNVTFAKCGHRWALSEFSQASSMYVTLSYGMSQMCREFDIYSWFKGSATLQHINLKITIVWERWNFLRSEINIDHCLIQCIRGFCSSPLPIFKLSLQVPWIDFRWLTYCIRLHLYVNFFVCVNDLTLPLQQKVVLTWGFQFLKARTTKSNFGTGPTCDSLHLIRSHMCSKSTSKQWSFSSVYLKII